MSKTFDLSTLNLSAGTHKITVKARASGYADSPASNAVSYVVAGDTVQVSGTWYFNVRATQSPYQSVNFTSNNTLYDAIYGEHQDLSYYKNGEGTEVNWRGTWTNEAYRTITFDGTQTVSKEFYEWLTANATRPISGTWKFNEFVYHNSVGQAVSFTSNGTTFSSIWIGNANVYYGDTIVTSAPMIDDSYCIDTEYRTIAFVGTQYVTQDFYEWFTSNAVFAFTIDGTTYYAKEGMTWYTWLRSGYNTGGFYAGSTLIFVYKNNQKYWVYGEDLEKTININGSYVTEKFSGAEPT